MGWRQIEEEQTELHAKLAQKKSKAGEWLVADENLEVAEEEFQDESPPPMQADEEQEEEQEEEEEGEADEGPEGLDQAPRKRCVAAASGCNKVVWLTRVRVAGGFVRWREDAFSRQHSHSSTLTAHSGVLLRSVVPPRHDFSW